MTEKPWYGGGGGSGDLLDLAGLDGNLDGQNAGLADLDGQNGGLANLVGRNGDLAVTDGQNGGRAELDGQNNDLADAHGGKVWLSLRVKMITLMMKMFSDGLNQLS